MLNPTQLAIQSAVAEAGHGRLKLPEKPFMCLAATRTVLERAFGWPSHDLYRRVCKWRVDGNFKRDPWAADFELSMRELGYTVPVSQVREGDIVFGGLPRPEGHVGIVFRGAGNKLWVFENATVRRRGGEIISGPNQMVPLASWERITTVGRFPADFVDKGGVDKPARPAPVQQAAASAKPPPAAELPDAAGPVPVVVVRDRAGKDIETPYAEAKYHGVIFRREPGRVLMRPEGSDEWES